MIALIIISVILALVLALLFVPISLCVRFDEDFCFKVKILGITVYKSGKEEKDKNKKPKQEKATAEKKSSLFARFKKKYGFAGAVKEFFKFFKDVISHTKKYWKNIKFRKFCLDIDVASDDAAKTAFDYGLVCTAAYPVLSFFETMANIEYKSINIRSDFEGKKSNFTFSSVIKSNPFFLLKIALMVYKDYQKFIARIETNE